MREPIPKQLDRRTFVTFLGSTGAVAVAGCTDDGEEPQDNPQAGSQGGSGGSQPDPSTETEQQEETPGGPDQNTSQGEDSGETDPEGTDSQSEDGAESAGGNEGTGEGTSYELTVTVVDSMDDPIEDASVTVEGEDGSSPTADPVRTGGNGEATVELPSGEYTVRVRADGYTETEAQVSVPDGGADLRVKLEEAADGASASGSSDNETDGNESGVNDGGSTPTPNGTA